MPDARLRTLTRIDSVYLDVAEGLGHGVSAGRRWAAHFGNVDDKVAVTLVSLT
jgi:hypothetical protein